MFPVYLHWDTNKVISPFCPEVHKVQKGFTLRVYTVTENETLRVLVCSEMLNKRFIKSLTAETDRDMIAR